MHRNRFINPWNSIWALCLLGFVLGDFQNSLQAGEEPFLNKQVLFEEKTNGYSVYRIPGIVVTAKDTILAYFEAKM
jgi:sialidase-1